jgi:glyoxylase-like metal-dependent hydrolase (beta-lactamase superfamily II)/ferredoxin
MVESIVAEGGFNLMADPDKALPANVSGNFFVDSTCIDCDTCRQLAPTTFVEKGNYSAVFHQPQSAIEQSAALRALLCCPTASIGTRDRLDVKEAIAEFPILLDSSSSQDVFYCGFNSPKSYGGNSYFVKRTDGNWLIDSPRYTSHLVKQFESLGGIKYIFLTHRDDVADAREFAKKFGASTIIHKGDLSAAPDCDIVIDESGATDFAPAVKIIPTPGHTQGHMVLLLDDKYLFTGDHLAYDRDSEELVAFRSVCWFSWKEQTKSMEHLLQYSFEWILPGHGDRVHLPKAKIAEEMGSLVSRMKQMH